MTATYSPSRKLPGVVLRHRDRNQIEEFGHRHIRPARHVGRPWNSSIW